MSVHIYHPTDKPTNLANLLIKEATVPVRGLFVLVLLFGSASAAEHLVALPVQAAHLALVERASDILADVSGRVLLCIVFRGLDGPRQGRQFHIS